MERLESVSPRSWIRSRSTTIWLKVTDTSGGTRCSVSAERFTAETRGTAAAGLSLPRSMLSARS